MKLPNLENAVVSEEKITCYLLNPKHQDGAGKAKFFCALGFSAETWKELANALRRLAEDNDVARYVDSIHGQKYIIEGRLDSPVGKPPLCEPFGLWIKGVTSRAW